MMRLLTSAMLLLWMCNSAHAQEETQEQSQAPLNETAPLPTADQPATTPGSTNQAEQTPPPPEAPPATATPRNYAVPPPPIGPLYPGPAEVGAQLESDEESPPIPARIATRLRVLGTDLDALASRDTGGLSSGVMSILAGGLSIALAQLIDQSALRTFLYIFGSGSLLRGGLELTLSPDALGASLSYSHMPMRVPEEVMDRLHYGERALADLANQSQRLRMLEGATSIGAGVITVPFLLLGPKNDSKDSKFDTLDLFVVVGAGVSVLSGVVSLLSSSEAEKRNDAYLELKKRLAKPAKTKAPAQVSFIAVPSAVALSVRGHFRAF